MNLPKDFVFTDPRAGPTIKISRLDRILCRFGIHLCPTWDDSNKLLVVVDGQCIVCGKQLRETKAYYIKEAKHES